MYNYIVIHTTQLYTDIHSDIYHTMIYIVRWVYCADSCEYTDKLYSYYVNEKDICFDDVSIQYIYHSYISISYSNLNTIRYDTI